ncbi:Uncharacterised protein [Actinomyces bovis]|uniref:DUF3618 domain-containing protein n=1 Tax=Actinomyces bovis TaxID=1658 RepID=A0ABY1VN39_9ACTO|nr:hypothetical protein [Actinomyces bovis]SPT53520.1 Uncharacterised protein [Actinomyces bovis]VEG55458.1 Uncharacterised protein [Actinomyces israelii]
MTDSAKAPAPTIAELEARLARQRESLAFDLESLGSRLAPVSLKTQAREQVNSTLASLRDRAAALRDGGSADGVGEAAESLSGKLGKLRERAADLLETKGEDDIAAPGSPLANIRTRAAKVMRGDAGACCGGSACGCPGRKRATEALGKLCSRAKGLVSHQEEQPAVYGIYAEATEAASSTASPAGSAVEDLPTRLRHLLDDARDGDPTALAVATGVALCLTGVATVAVVRAVRR